MIALVPRWGFALLRPVHTVLRLAPRALILAPLRRMRGALRLARQAWGRRRQLGWAGIAVHAYRRLTSEAAAAGPRPADPRPADPRPLNQARPPDGSVFDVIYAIGFWPGEPKRYRVFNRAEALRAAGYEVHVMPFDDLDDIRRYRWRASVLVLFRAEYDWLSGIKGVLVYARDAGIRLVYDIDDLVFDPAVTDRIDAVRRMQPYDRRLFVNATARRLRMMRACDLVTASTAPLAHMAERLGCRATVIPNSLNSEQLRVAAELAVTAPARTGGVIIAYLSGSPTHQRDFAECESALIEVMERHPEVRFRLVGYLDLGIAWDCLRDRIERRGFLPPADLLRCIAETDINLAPLELGNPFCEAKSELKFFEAALLGVPTIASATETFSAAIEDGVSGHLVRNPAEWRDALELLVTCQSRRRMIGEAARARALAEYGPAALTPRVIAALGLPPPRSAKPAGWPQFAA
jgi:glycosyltransferase involved in cell wall biosynthesis